MRVNTTAQARRTAKAKGAGGAKSSGGVFELGNAPESQQASSVRGAQAIAGVDALLALQGVGDATSERAKAVERGDMMLDLLEDIRLDLLGGAMPEGRLRKLLTLVAQRSPQAEDRKLQAVLDEIELRARVELAKYGR